MKGVLLVTLLVALVAVPASSEELVLLSPSQADPQAACTSYGPAKVTSTDLNLDVGSAVYRFHLYNAGPWTLLNVPVDDNTHTLMVIGMLRDACINGLDTYLCTSGNTLYAVSFVGPASGTDDIPIQ